MSTALFSVTGVPEHYWLEALSDSNLNCNKVVGGFALECVWKDASGVFWNIV